MGTKVTEQNKLLQRGLYCGNKDCMKLSIFDYNLENCSLFSFLVFLIPVPVDMSCTQSTSQWHDAGVQREGLHE